MKNLIFVGSARKKGLGMEMAAFLKEHLEGESEIIRAYDLEISPCMDCRACFKKGVCVIDDQMQDIYRKIEDADNFVFVSPVYFYSVPGPLKTMIDRLQVYWVSHHQGSENEQDKYGAMVLSGGGPLFPGQFTAAEIVLTGALKDMQAQVMGTVHLCDADHSVFDEEHEVKCELVRVAGILNNRD